MLLILVFTLTDAKANDTSLVKKQNIGISKIGANSKKRMSFSDSAIQIPQKQFQYLCSQKVFCWPVNNSSQAWKDRWPQQSCSKC